MPAINIHDMNVFSACPDIDQGIVDNCQIDTPELALFPNEVIDGTTTKSLIRSQRMSNRIFHKTCDFVCPDKGQFEPKLVEAVPFKQIVTVCTHDEMGAPRNDFTSQSALEINREDTLSNVFEQIAAALYQDTNLIPGAYTGLQRLTAIEVDAMSKDFNYVQDFIDGADFDSATDQFTSAYLVRKAESANDIRGLRWLFGGGQAVAFTDPFPTSIEDPNNPGCYRKEIHQYVEGFVTIKCKSEFDVAVIRNIPRFCLDGFYLDNVIRRLYALLPKANKPNCAIIDDEAVALWELQRQNSDATFQGLEALEGPLGENVVVMKSTGRSLPIIKSQLIPCQDYVPGLDQTAQKPKYQSRLSEINAAAKA